MKAPAPSEDQVHITILEWFRLKRDCVVFHIPNGGKRGWLAGAKMKRLGTLPGAPDLVVLYAMMGEPKTLLIEVKAVRGEQSKEQREFEEACKDMGHDYIVVRSLDDVIRWWGGS